MTMQTSTDRLHRYETDSPDPEFNFESFVPVLMMSCFGLSLSLLIISILVKFGISTA